VTKRDILNFLFLENTLIFSGFPLFQWVKKASHNVKIAKTYWNLSILFISLFIWLSYQGKQNKKLRAEYIKTPQQGDLYEYKVLSGSYSTFKVDSVSKDSVYVFLNDFEINKSSRVYKIDKPENYSKNGKTF